MIRVNFEVFYPLFHFQRGFQDCPKAWNIPVDFEIANFGKKKNENLTKVEFRDISQKSFCTLVFNFAIFVNLNVRVRGFLIWRAFFVVEMLSCFCFIWTWWISQLNRHSVPNSELKSDLIFLFFFKFWRNPFWYLSFSLCGTSEIS